jgi:anti-sigma regulatory factor (Ser/Thr protein kinase)
MWLGHMFSIPPSNIGQQTDVFACNVQQHLQCTGPPARQGTLMNTMAPTRLSVRRRSAFLALTTEPAAAAAARRHVQEAIEAWGLPADPYVATLLTSELVTNAIRHGAGETVRLLVTCSFGHLRVYVHDTSRTWPAPLDTPADAEAGRGLMLVASLSTDWGWYLTPAGKAVYFTLALDADPDRGDADSVHADRRWHHSP